MARLVTLLAFAVALVLLAVAPAQAFDDRLQYTYPKSMGKPATACKKVKEYCHKIKTSKGFSRSSLCESTPKSNIIQIVCEDIKGTGNKRKVVAHVKQVAKHFKLKSVP